MSTVLHPPRLLPGIIRSIPRYNARRSPDSGALRPDRADRLLTFTIEELPPDEDVLSDDLPFSGEDDLVDEE